MPRISSSTYCWRRWLRISIARKRAILPTYRKVVIIVIIVCTIVVAVFDAFFVDWAVFVNKILILSFCCNSYDFAIILVSPASYLTKIATFLKKIIVTRTLLCRFVAIAMILWLKYHCNKNTSFIPTASSSSLELFNLKNYLYVKHFESELDLFVRGISRNFWIVIITFEETCIRVNLNQDQKVSRGISRNFWIMIITVEEASQG